MQNITTIALSRLAAQERVIDVAASNMANTGTPGFHAERMVFADWLLRQPVGSQPPGGRPSPIPRTAPPTATSAKAP